MRGYQRRTLKPLKRCITMVRVCSQLEQVIHTTTRSKTKSGTASAGNSELERARSGKPNASLTEGLMREALSVVTAGGVDEEIPRGGGGAKEEVERGERRPRADGAPPTRVTGAADFSSKVHGV